MLEVIGIIICCLIAWSIIKFFSQANLKANLRLAIGFASERGVPQNFSISVVETPDSIHIVRNQMRKGDRYCKSPFLCTKEFTSLPVSEQYGNVLVEMYKDSLAADKREKAPKPTTGRIVSVYEESNSDDISYLVHLGGQNYELQQLVDKNWRTLWALSAADDDNAAEKCWNRITGTFRH